MIILAMDTSGPCASVALMQDGVRVMGLRTHRPCCLWQSAHWNAPGFSLKM